MGAVEAGVGDERWKRADGGRVPEDGSRPDLDRPTRTLPDEERWAPVGRATRWPDSGSRERLQQVGQQILRVLEPDGEPEQVVRRR